MADWPADVPFFDLRNGYGQSEPDNVLRTPMDTGDIKSRRRTVTGRRAVSGSAYMTRAEYRDARAFVADTLKGGTLRFTAADPVTGVTQTYQLTAPLVIAPMGSGWNVTAQMDIVP